MRRHTRGGTRRVSDGEGSGCPTRALTVQSPRSRGPLRKRLYRSRASNRLQVLDQILLLFCRQVQIEVAVVVLDHVCQRCKTTVVVEATFVNLVHVEQG